MPVVSHRPLLSPRRWLIGGLLVGALIFTALAIWKGVRLWPHASSLLNRARGLQDLIKDAQVLASPERLVWMREQLGDTRRELQFIRAEIKPLLPLAEHLVWVPRVGGLLAASPALLDVAIELCDAGWWGLLGAEPIIDAVSRRDEGSDQTVLEAILPMLSVSQPRFAEAEEAVARAQSARGRAKGQSLPPDVGKWVARLDRYLPILEAATQLAQAAPELLGAERSVTYLILAQNSHEIRPTGGFISGVGVMQLSQGRIITTTFEDSYQVDVGCDLGAHPPAPKPLREYMWAPVLTFRDANWSPDFPTSAAVATSIYRLCRNAVVDGVIALDLGAVVTLLEAVGPLQPKGYPVVVTSASLLESIEQYWTDPLRSGAVDEGGEWWLHRKDFMGDVLQAALQKVTTAPETVELGKLARAMFAALQGKHLQAWLRDGGAARALAAVGWDGALQSPSGDYLMIVDSNVGFRKVNPRIGESVEYQVDLSRSVAPRATLTLRYVNENQDPTECVAGARYEESYQQLMEGCYWNYARIYVPAGSRLLGIVGSDRQPEAFEEAGKAVFSAFLVVAPGQTREIVFNYELPHEVVGTARASVYHLMVQKQPGSEDVPVKVGVSGGQWELDALLSDVHLGSDTGQIEFDLASDTALAWMETRATYERPSWLLVLAAGGGIVILVAGLAVWRYAQSQRTQAGHG